MTGAPAPVEFNWLVGGLFLLYVSILAIRNIGIRFQNPRKVVKRMNEAIQAWAASTLALSASGAWT